MLSEKLRLAHTLPESHTSSVGGQGAEEGGGANVT